jgi:uncharacterized membrane protein YcaP (DUF421 family)
MEPVIRAVTIYVAVMVFIRFSGRRTLAELTVFDFVLLLIISEATQQGMIRDDYSLTNAIVVIVSLILIDIILSLIRQKWNVVDRWFEGVPMVLINDGKLLKDRLDRSRVDENDILEAARRLRGLENMSQIRYAVLEKDGSITIIPFALTERMQTPPT